MSFSSISLSPRILLQVCSALRKMSSVLRLGVYRERIERYVSASKAAHSASSGCSTSSSSSSVSTSASSSVEHHRRRRHQQQQQQHRRRLQQQRHRQEQCRKHHGCSNGGNGHDHQQQQQQQDVEEEEEEVVTVVLERHRPGTQLGLRLGEDDEDEVDEDEQHPDDDHGQLFIADVQEGGAVAADGRLEPGDRLLEVNGRDVRRCGLEEASHLIQVKQGARLD